jgi:hypothetical protein
MAKKVFFKLRNVGSTCFFDFFPSRRGKVHSYIGIGGEIKNWVVTLERSDILDPG